MDYLNVPNHGLKVHASPAKQPLSYDTMVGYLFSPRNASNNPLAPYREIEPKSRPVSVGVATYTGSAAGNFTTLVCRTLSSDSRWPGSVLSLCEDGSIEFMMSVCIRSAEC